MIELKNIKDGDHLIDIIIKDPESFIKNENDRVFLEKLLVDIENSRQRYKDTVIVNGIKGEGDSYFEGIIEDMKREEKYKNLFGELHKWFGGKSGEEDFRFVDGSSP